MTASLFHTAEDGNRGPEVLTVRQLNERISEALKASFAGAVWVKGEVQRLPVDAARRKHVYFELHETGASGAAEYQIPVALMEWDRKRYGLGCFLDGRDPDLQLANQMEVCLQAEVDFYPPFGKLSLKIIGVDKTFSLGRLEAKRREVLAYLAAQGLMEKQRRLVLRDLPLRVGLVTAAGSAAERDFMTGLDGSGFPFRVSLRGAKMQGAQLQGEVIRAVNAHVAAGVDVIVITRGGGSRADLSWFDQQDLAVAIAECPVPVVTAIGHEIDQSIADMVAHHACKTPTAVAEFLVDRVETAERRLDEAAREVGRAVAELLDRAAQRMDIERRLVWASERRLHAARQGSQTLAGKLQRRVTAGLGSLAGNLGLFQSRLAGRTGAAVARENARCEGLMRSLASVPARGLKGQEAHRQALIAGLDQAVRTLLEKRGLWLDQAAVQVRLQDPVRLLARGYTLTLTAQGKVLKRAEGLTEGQKINTRFSDGIVASIVQAEDGPTGPVGETKKGNQRGRRKKDDPAQKTLFR